MKAFWKYTLARAALLAVTYVVLWAAASMRWNLAWIDPFVLLAAIIVSSGISLFALRGLREEFADQLQQRAGRMAQRVEQSRNADDVD